MNTRFNNQVAIITGAASGLGFIIAQQLSAKGVQLALVDRNPEGLEKAGNQLPGKYQLFPIDITSEEQVKEMVERTADYFGHIDILVNCAGITFFAGNRSKM